MKRDEKGHFIKGSSGNTFEGFGVFYCKGYPKIFIDGKNIMIHVYVWERANGIKPRGFDIHHKDENKKNYLLSNLELITKSDHLRLHAGWVRNEKREWIMKPCKGCKRLHSPNNFYQREGLTPSNLCKKCSSEYSKNKLKENPKYREKKRLYLQEYYRKNKKQILQKQKDARKTKLSGV